MSQLRENLNPGLEGDQVRPHHLLHQHHVHQHQQPDSNSAAAVSIRVEPPSEEEDDEVGPDEEDSKGQKATGNDSDPPIENENPYDGDECFETDFNAGTVSSLERKKELEIARKRAQAQHKKRKKSTHNGDGTYIPPYKKNRNFNFFRRQTSVLPSKFLLGGNIRDPLNLASLSDAQISAELNRVTPHSSPLPVQGEVPVFIPKNPHDPLGLTTRTPENAEDMIVGVRNNANNNKNRKHRHRKRPGRKRTESECSIGTEMTEGDDNENQLNTNNRKRRISDKGVGLDISDDEENENACTQETSRGGKRKRSLSEPSVGVVSASVSRSLIDRENKAAKLPPPSDVIPVKEKAPAASGSQVSNVDQISIAPKPDTEKEAKSKPIDVVKSKDNNRTSESTDRQETGKTTSATPTEGDGGKTTHSQGEAYPSQPSDYTPRSYTYAPNTPSPFAFDSPDYYYDAPHFESPTFSYQYTPSHEMQPFSPPPRPEMPRFQRRMQMFTSMPPRPEQLSLQRAVFQRPFSRRRMRQKGDPIVSPVIPQPGSRRRPHHHHNNHMYNKKGIEKPTTSGVQSVAQGTSNATVAKDNESSVKESSAKQVDAVDGAKGKKYRPKDQVFQFGNYNQYYGYRTPDQSDPRLWVLKKWYFEGKDVLDIGCNTGHVTLSIARDFEPRRVHGIDIDFSLITVARKNIKHYMIRDPQDKTIVFPRSLPLIYGAMQPPPGVAEKTPKAFPYNVSFAHENYVLQSDELLESVKPEYDVIICLSVSKWIHLNFGDDGLKRFFKRVFSHLRSGGVFIFEPQPWSSYSKKKKLTEKIHQMYKSIKFFPDQFEEYLLNKIGFVSVESLGTPVHHAKGFQRPLLLFTKEESSEALPVFGSPCTISAASTSSPYTPVVVASTSASKASASCTVTSCGSLSPDECTSTVVPSSSNKSASVSEDHVCSSSIVTTITNQIITPSSINLPTSSSEQQQSDSCNENDFEVSSAEQPGDHDEGAYDESETDDGVTSSSDPR